VGRAWGFSDVLKKRQELSTLTAELREAEKEVINRQNALETLHAAEEADEAEITTAERFLRRAEAAVQQLEQRQQTLQQDIAVADWLERDPDVSDQEAEVRSRLSAYKTAIMPQSGLLSELEDVEFAHFRDLMGLLGERVEGGGEQRAYERLQTAVARERDARAASEIRVLLAQGGVDMAAIRSGEDTMGTWLIAMAMLTCTVGIANAMLMSVTERYREIATMKCLGAQDSLVVKLFLLESGLQGIAGAVIGLPVGLGVALMISSVLFGSYGWVYFPWASSMSAILMSLLAGIILAVIGAVGPAIAAARMKPVDALRVEE